MKRSFLILLTLFAIVANMMAYDKTSITITVNGQQRNMIVFTPSQRQNNMPLMIITHGMGQSPEYQSEDGDKMYELIDTEKFICAYLRADGSTWDISGDKDVNFVSQTIDEMYSRYQIDKNRVYWSGFSMGSMLIYNGIKKIADKIAAFAPTSGVKFDLNPSAELKQKGIKVNLIHHHSNQDTVFPIDKYKPYDYVKEIAVSNGSGNPTAVSYQSQEGNYKGTKTTWKNSDGNEVVCFMYDGGGHWPSYYNRKEIWNFCKRWSKGSSNSSNTNTGNTQNGSYVPFTKTLTLTQTDSNTTLCNMSTSNGVTTFTVKNGGEVEVVYKMLNVDVSGYSKVIVTFAEALPTSLLAAFGSDQPEIAQGSTSYTYEIPSGTTTLSEIALISLWKNAGTTIKVKSVELYGEKWVENTTTTDTTDSYSDLLAKDFFNWTAADASGMKKENTNCAYELGKSTGMPYGDGNVNYLNYADLSHVDKINVTATEGEPRLLFNRIVHEGTVNVEVPRDKDEYEKVTTNSDGSKTYVVDVAKIVSKYGFAHLHAIKGANWQNTTVTSIKYTEKFTFEGFDPTIFGSGKKEVNNETRVISYFAGQWGFGGWHSSEGYDVSIYNKITIEFEEAPSDGVSFRLFDADNYWGSPICEIDCDGKKSVSYDISNVKKLYYVGVWAIGSENLSKSPIKIKSVKLSSSKVDDVNCDGTVDMLDVQTLQRITLGSANNTPNSDINGDGKVNTIDITLLINKLNAK